MERNCDICGKMYGLIQQDIGELFLPVYLSDTIEVKRYDEDHKSFEYFKVCRACANNISNHIQKRILESRGIHI